MNKQILVALESENPLGRIIPYLDTATLANTKVILLIPYCKAAKRQAPWDEDSERLPGAGETMSAWKAYLQRESADDQQKRLAELRLALAELAMRKKGVDIVTDIYSGRLRAAINRYVRNGDVRLIIRRKKFGVGFSALLQRLVLRVSRLKNLDFFSWHCSLRSTGCRS